MTDGKTRETNAMPPGPYAELEKIEAPFVAVQNLGNFNLHQFRTICSRTSGHRPAASG